MSSRLQNLFLAFLQLKFDLWSRVSVPKETLTCDPWPEMKSFFLNCGKWLCFNFTTFFLSNFSFLSAVNINTHYSSQSAGRLHAIPFHPFCPSFAHSQPSLQTLFFFFIVVTHSLSIVTKSSQRATAQTAGPVCLLINGINHLALQGQFILKMNYLKVQHNAVSFLLLPHYCSGRLRTHHWPFFSAPFSHHPTIFFSSYFKHPPPLPVVLISRKQPAHSYLNQY